MAQTVCVAYNGVAKEIPRQDAKLPSFLTRVFAAFGIGSPQALNLGLAFQTASPDCCATVTTDLALRLVLGTSSAAGLLVVVEKARLPSVDHCMQSVFKAVVDTAARRDAAAVFLALSGAWERAVRDVADTAFASVVADPNLAHHPNPSPPPPPSSSSCAPTASAFPCGCAAAGVGTPPGCVEGGAMRDLRRVCRQHASCPRRLHDAVARSVGHAVGAEVQRAMADAAVSRLSECSRDEVSKWDVGATADAETRALACFWSHRDVSCSHCHVSPITGTRYRWRAPTAAAAAADADTDVHADVVAKSDARGEGGVDLCERCRRVLADAAVDDDRDFVMFDHPWEASEEYAALDAAQEEENASADTPPRAHMHMHNMYGGGSGSGSGGGGGGGGGGSGGAGATSDRLRAPAPPLRQGDVGPRVLHLHYVLHKIGYLSVGGGWFEGGVFCGDTCAAVARFQTDHWVSGMVGGLGVYNAVTRGVLLSLLDEVDRRDARMRCAAVPDAQEPRLRMALAA